MLASVARRRCPCCTSSGAPPALLLQALQALCDRNDCDIRSCLNTLQFLARRPNGPGGRITLSQVRQVAVGTKDTTRSALAIWSDILQTRRAGGGARRGPTAAADTHRELWEGITAFGENDLVSLSNVRA